MTTDAAPDAGRMRLFRRPAGSASLRVEGFEVCAGLPGAKRSAEEAASP